MTDMIELLEEYESWKKRTTYPDTSLAAFKDYHYTQQVLQAVASGVTKDDYTEAVALLDLPEDVMDWLQEQHVEKEFDLE